MKARIAQPGFRTTVQDGGRPGWRALGVSPGGACDAFAARVLNRLVGNGEGAAVLEVELGGLRIEMEEPCLAAWGGGAFQVRLAGQDVPPGRPALLVPGEQLAFGYARTGCRAWLALAGGFDTLPILESRSTDARAGFGGWEGRALQPGDEIPLGPASEWARALVPRLEHKRVAALGAPATWTARSAFETTLRVVRGAEWERLSAEARTLFAREPFTVTPDANRMGARLNGPALTFDDARDLLSEGVAPGTIQLPPGGQPILLLADGQTIGGYPKLAHVITVDLPLAAQLRPNDPVRFHEVTMTEAHTLLQQRERELARFARGLELGFGLV